MEQKEILSKCDHTLLTQTCALHDIYSVCDDGIRYETASVCIPPCYVKDAKRYVKNKIAICTVIGFPNGYNSTDVKVFETEQAIKDGADEIDMVINVGMLKDGKHEYVIDEIERVKRACNDKILKVIIETCLLTKDEIKTACQLVTKGGADYIKTSTGFSVGGATLEDVVLMKNNVGENVLVKASGGISGIKDGEEFLKAGASRLGTSRIVKEVKNQNSQGGY